MNLRAAWRTLWSKADASDAGPPSDGDPPRYGYWGATDFWGSGPTGRQPGSGINWERDVGRLDLNAVVRLCIGWYADNIPQATLRVGTRLDSGERQGEWDEDPDHAITRVFRRPCPVFSARETWAMIVAGRRIDGNAYLIKVRDHQDWPVELWWVPNHQVTVVGSGDPRRPVDRYVVEGGGLRQEYDPEDVVHIRDLPDPENPIMGIGRLKAFLRSIVGLNAAETYTASVLKNAHAGLLFAPKSGDILGGGLEERDIRSAIDAIYRNQTGAMTGRPHGVNVPIEVLHTGMSPESMKLDRITDRAEAMICAAFGLSPLLLDLPSSRDTKTYANKAEARRGAWEDGVVAEQDAIAEALRDNVLYQYDPETGEPEGAYGDPPGLEVWWDRSEVPALREDFSAKAKTWIDLALAEICTNAYAASQLDIPEEAVPEPRPVPEQLEGPVESQDDDGESDDGEEEAAPDESEAEERESEAA